MKKLTSSAVFFRVLSRAMFRLRVEALHGCDHLAIPFVSLFVVHCSYRLGLAAVPRLGNRSEQLEQSGLERESTAASLVNYGYLRH